MVKLGKSLIYSQLSVTQQTLFANTECSSKIITFNIFQGPSMVPSHILNMNSTFTALKTPTQYHHSITIELSFGFALIKFCQNYSSQFFQSVIFFFIFAC